MRRVCFLMQILVCYFRVECRKYDVDSESVKLFGEGLNTVLKRFRKTPEYMNLLNDRVGITIFVADLKQNFNDMIEQLTYVHQEKLEQKINETIAAQEKENKGELRGRVEMGRQGNPEDSADNENQNITSLSPVEMLDSNPLFKSPLTVSEKNFYKDMGFEFAGNAIHGILQNMRQGDMDDCDNPKSTRIAGHNAKETTTTEHVSVHEVTTPKEVETTAATNPSYKHRAEIDKAHDAQGKTSFNNFLE